MSENNKFRKEGEQEAAKQQKIQKQIDKTEKKGTSKKKEKPPIPGDKAFLTI